MQPTTFLTNPVHEKLEQLKQVLIKNENRENLPVENINFFEAFYNYCKDRLNLTIPLLIQEAELTSLVSEIEGGTAHIIVYFGDKNIGHLNNAVNNFYSALNRIRNFPFPLSNDDFNYSNQVATFQNAIKRAYDNLNIYSKGISEKLEATEIELKVKEARIMELSQKLTEKETEIQNVINRYNTEFEALKVSANSEVEVEKKKFNQDVDSDRRSFKEQFDASIKEYLRIFEEKKLAIDGQATDVVNSLNMKLEKAKKIVNIIGNVGVTGNYQNIANQHRGTANVLRRTAFFFMALMSGLLVWSIIELGNKDFDLYRSLVRVLAAVVLTYPAIYASRESTRHRNLETLNRNLELELASIGPFIEILPEVEQQKIKQDLVKKYFGNHMSDFTSKKAEDEDVSINVLEKILKAILPFIKK